MVSSSSSGGEYNGQEPLAAAMSSMRRMVARAVARCADEVFHDMLYTALFNDRQFEQLFAIRTPQVEVFLREADPTKLYAYYEHHGEFARAANLMSQLAHSEMDLPIAVRIRYLQRAVASAEKAVSTSSGGMETSSTPARSSSQSAILGGTLISSSSSSGVGADARKALSDNLVELRDTLDIAGNITIFLFYATDDDTDDWYNCLQNTSCWRTQSFLKISAATASTQRLRKVLSQPSRRASADSWRRWRRWCGGWTRSCWASRTFFMRCACSTGCGTCACFCSTCRATRMRT